MKPLVCIFLFVAHCILGASGKAEESVAHKIEGFREKLPDWSPEFASGQSIVDPKGEKVMLARLADLVETLGLTKNDTFTLVSYLRDGNVIIRTIAVFGLANIYELTYNEIANLAQELRWDVGSETYEIAFRKFTRTIREKLAPENCEKEQNEPTN